MRTRLAQSVLPLLIMWVVILLGMAFLVETPAIRIWMAVIGGGATVGVLVRYWLDARGT